MNRQQVKKILLLAMVEQIEQNPLGMLQYCGAQSRTIDSAIQELRGEFLRRSGADAPVYQFDDAIFEVTGRRARLVATMDLDDQTLVAVGKSS